MSQQLRRTKIIATLGPATDKGNNLEKIIISGANIVRLNFSHGKTQEHFVRAEKVRKIASKLSTYIAILGDLQGPKIRISTFQGNKIYLKSGDNFLIDAMMTNNNKGNHKCVGVDYEELAQDVHPEDLLLLDDGRIQLKVITIHNTKIYTKVIIGGMLYNNKGLNKLGGGLSAKVLTNKDKIDIITAAQIGVDYLAISFPRSSIDLNCARKLIVDAGSHAKIISKIERAEVVASDETIDDIIHASDAVMVARGDLGVEIGEPELVGVQKKIIQRARALNRAVITATQMMESMVHNSMPTRAEVMDVANAVLDGTDAVMLSAETATGQYPSETVAAMANVCLGAEKISNINFLSDINQKKKFDDIEEAIAISAMYTANHLTGVSAVIVLTEFESTTLLMSRINSKLPIFALSQHKHILNIVTLYKGVIPIYFNKTGNNVIDAKYASNLLRDKGLLLSGELVVVIQNDIYNKCDVINISHILQVK
ncbi:pyruvate kinase [Candidatus Blochmanniella camponoti]|uniref:Pyruvate kinase n=1 Tax=Candidatus Blochmanniella camponoti TaxID=108080 RepID=A0AAE9IB15_9ENTR|nr:pyruvate kinase [Candidatus Blochmannia herculeanus]URJ24295.1 pyruvate kinase [Candidatus Blochmannia herculeanus]URJ27651.1 pyruvate kinase [Candidatus Blochmannia herculeanus]